MRRRPEEMPRALVISDAQSLPRRWYGYDSVKHLLITTSDNGMLDAMTAEQRAALSLGFEW